MKRMTPLLWEIIAEHLNGEAQLWLKSKEKVKPLDLMTAFVAAPRYLPKTLISPSGEHSGRLTEIADGFSVENWSLVRLARVWMLSLFDDTEEQQYVHYIRTLFDTAEMNELVALYSALPLLSYPERWLATASDAVRSNIGLVLDAVALQNPYPAKYFDEGAWNQLVMKTIFNDKPIQLIYGIEQRTNADLTRILVDFAHERWAAGRQVPPAVWRLVTPFVNDGMLADLKHLLESARPGDRQAAALVCLRSGFPPALELLEYYPEMKKLGMEGNLNWMNSEINNPNAYVS